MIAAALDAGIDASWVTGDEAYGQNPGLRALLESRRISYVLAVACSMRVRINQGRTAVRADAVADRLPASAWHRQSAGAGAKGPRYYDWAWIEISADRHRHLLIRHNPGSGELALYLCWSPRRVPLSGLVKVAGTRRCIEESFQAAKGQGGLDHYQVRHDAEAFLTPYEDLAVRRGRRSARARLGLARGRLTAARGDIDAARMEFEQALAQLEHLPLQYDRARVNFAYGQTMRRAGKRREADTVLKNARDGYATLGAPTYVERCERELQASGLHSTRLTPGMSQLTPQERAVARLFASGATNQQTALELFISVRTVRYHLTHV